MGIKLRRSAVAGKAPVVGDLELGELALNTTDGKLFTKKSASGTESIVEVGPVASVAGKTGAVTLAKADVGLGNVDNTSDANKPISTATQAALNAKASAASPNLSGAIDLTTGSVRQTASAVSALDIDCSSGNYFTKTVSSASTFTFSNPPASGKVYVFILRITFTNGSVGWPGTVQWPSAVVPPLDTGKTHLLIFLTEDGGTTWRGASLRNYNS
jgi:hypothetical protein